MWWSPTGFNSSVTDVTDAKRRKTKRKEISSVEKAVTHTPRRNLQESWWWEKLTMVSGCSGVNTSLPASPGCSNSRLNNVEDLMQLCVCCACVKDKLWVNSVTNSPDFTRRSCVKTSIFCPNIKANRWPPVRNSSPCSGLSTYSSAGLH